jgi:hypothetical protein
MKRILVEAEVDDFVAQAMTTSRGASVSFGDSEVRSVEVVEPERWTELVLRIPPGWTGSPGDHRIVTPQGSEIPLSYGHVVVSCTEREEYPT